MFNTIDEAISWVTQRMGKNIGFTQYQDYCEKYNPHMNELNYIHVAGTNGKGSTCNFLCDCLMSAGYKVGTFTSPHLVCHQDRICINHEWISDDEFLAICNERVFYWIEYNLNMFEIDFEIMTYYFNKMNVDFVILEVGLGGRFDCTNSIAKSLASIIVSIGFDHMDRLGNTLAEIAYEKAGIIKNNGLVISGVSDIDASNMIHDVACKKSAELIEISNVLENSEKNQFTYRGLPFELSTMAHYQIHNAGCAIETLLQLREKKLIDITDSQIKEGLLKSNWAGRFEKINDHPCVIIDGAHNEPGIKELVKSIKKLNKKVLVVFSALKDKDTDHMVKELLDNCDTMIVTEFDFYRVQAAQNLKIDESIIVIENYKEAIEYAKKIAEDHIILICGSLYFISEVRKYFKDN